MSRATGEVAETTSNQEATTVIGKCIPAQGQGILPFSGKPIMIKDICNEDLGQMTTCT